MHSKYTPKDIQRFWKKVDKSGGEDACWTWTGRPNRNGYGRFGIGHNVFYTHRFAYEITVGEIPEGIGVCHSCDNPQCCNPKHLFLGTQADNVFDMIRKGRMSKKGQFQPKLSDEQVEEIRKRYRRYRKFGPGASNSKELASEFGISPITVSSIARGDRRVR